jgi:hypothetical protein
LPNFAHRFANANNCAANNQWPHSTIPKLQSFSIQAFQRALKSGIKVGVKNLLYPGVIYAPGMVDQYDVSTGVGGGFAGGGGSWGRPPSKGK